MKYLVTLLLFVASTFTGQLFAKEIYLDTEIEEVRLYLTAAEIKRQHPVTLSAGKHTIIFTGLSPVLATNSIQASVSGNVTILSVTSKTNFTNPVDENEDVAEINGMIHLYKTKAEELQNKINAHNAQLEMLKANYDFGGNQATISTEQIEKTSDYFFEKILAINSAISALRKEKESAEEELANWEKQLHEATKNQKPVTEIHISIDVKTPVEAVAKLRYVVGYAGWSPIYDLFAGDLSEPIKLEYRALVYNATGIDWNDRKIILSTADPNQSAKQPELEPWELDYEYDFRVKKGRNQYLRDDDNDGVPMHFDREPPYEGAPVPIRFEQISISELNKDFELEKPYTIPSDGKPYSVEISAHDFDASYAHLTIPKMDNGAFVMAAVPGWEEHDFIEGPMNVYHGESFVGESYLDTYTIEDTLELSLGRDKKVVVQREKLKDFSSKKLLGSTRKTTLAYEITVKNTHSLPIKVEIQDQIPISTQSDIEVEALELSKGNHFENSGLVEWQMELEAGESKTVKLAFSIKYPKNKKVIIQKSRVIAAPRF